MLHVAYRWIYVYIKKNGGSRCFVLASSSVSDSSRTKQSAIFLEMPKPNHIKMFLFRKHFSHSFKKHIWFNMFLFMHFDLFYFLYSVCGKKCSENSFLAYIVFAISNALFDSIWHKRYYQHKIWSPKVKKIQDNIFWSLEMSARGNFPKMVEITKNLKNCVVCVESQCPKCSQIVLKLINLAILTVEFYKFG